MWYYGGRLIGVVGVLEGSLVLCCGCRLVGACGLVIAVKVV